jgi:hypothetical protein
MGERKRRIAVRIGEIDRALANSERLFARVREGDCSGVISAVVYWEEANETIKKIGVEAIPDGIAGRFLALRDLCERYSEAVQKAMTDGDDVEEARLAKEEGYDLLLQDYGGIQFLIPLNQAAADWQKAQSGADWVVATGAYDRATAAEKAGLKIKLLYRPPQI